MEPIIKVDHLVKNFHSSGNKSRLTLNAVNDISFSVEQGDFLGYIGPNGAGKSTTIKILSGLLVPTSGSVTVNGYIPWKDRQKYVKNIGAVFGQRSTLWWDLPVLDSFEMIRYMYSVQENKYKDNLSLLKKMLSLDEIINKPVRTLSLGQRMRAELSAVLLYEPDIIFLDEPTIGLDLVAKNHIREFLAAINISRGTTILLTTHDLSDVEKLCRNVIIIDHGNIVFQGSLANLSKKYGGKHRLIADVEEEPVDFQVNNADSVSVSGKRIIIDFVGNKENISGIMQQLVQQFTIRDIEVKKPDIENVVRAIYENGK